MAYDSSRLSDFRMASALGDHDGSSYQGDRIEQNFKVELQYWTEVNKSLRHHGLPAVKLLHPGDISMALGKVICLDNVNSNMARQNLTSMMADCDHRQTLIQDLILTNNKLKEDLAIQTTLYEKNHSKIKDLKIMLESSRSRVKELESKRDDSLLSADEEEKLQNTKKAMHAKCKQLEKRCQNQDAENNRLKEKLQRQATEEEKRTARQHQVFHDFKKRTARVHNVVDEKLLDIIDAYEKQIYKIQKELEHCKYDGRDPRFNDDSEPDDTSYYAMPATQNVKELIRSYEKQQRHAKALSKKLEEENEILKLDLQSRPDTNDFRMMKQRLQKMEKCMQLHNISLPGEKLIKDPYRMKKKYSTKLEDLDYLPLDICRKQLKDIAVECEVDDISNVIRDIHSIRDKLNNGGKYEDFCHDVYSIVKEMENFPNNGRRLRASPYRKFTPSDTTLEHTLSVLTNWREDIVGLQLHQSVINKITEKLTPSIKHQLAGEASVCEMTAALNRILADEDLQVKTDSKNHHSKAMLESIVEHFQTLFDVQKLAGVYPRMNDIYSKLGEVHNVLHTLKSLLGLADDSKSTAIVDAVGRLCVSHNNSTAQQLKLLLQTDDLNGGLHLGSSVSDFTSARNCLNPPNRSEIIGRLEEHAEFFPVFHEVMNKLFEILGVQRMEQVLPAVRALKLLSA